MSKIPAKFDPNFDVVLTLAADRRRGIWAADVRIKGSRSRWSCGQLATDTSEHGLLAAALISALRSVHTKQIRDVLASEQRPATSKLRVQVLTRDKTFGDAIAAKIAKQPEPILRTGKQMLMPLAKELARFQVAFRGDSNDNNRILALRGWARDILDPTTKDIFAPAGATTLAPSRYQEQEHQLETAVIKRAVETRQRPELASLVPLTPKFF